MSVAVVSADKAPAAKYIIAWNDDRFLLPTKTDRITLQTCLGPYLTSRRLVVIAVPAY